MFARISAPYTLTCDNSPYLPLCAGAALLPKVAAYGAAALHSPEHSLRQLGAKQLGRILLAEAQAGSDGSDVLTQLVDTLADVDTGVSHTAAAALQRFATTPEGARVLLPCRILVWDRPVTLSLKWPLRR